MSNPASNPASNGAPADRRPLDLDALRAAVAADGAGWGPVDLAESIGSSNTALADRARRGDATHGAVLVVEEQTAGRGRRERGWVAPKYSSAMFSVLLEPSVDRARWGWLPLLAALAVSDALGVCAQVEPGIKWPNDVMLDEQKVAGILSEVIVTPQGPGVVVGVGINVNQSQDELPMADATSVCLAAGRVDRAGVVVACLRELDKWYHRWVDEGPDGDSLVAAYGRRSSTLGRAVRVLLPDGQELRGVASRIDAGGHLVVQVDGADRVVAAADVVHLRPDEAPGLSR